MEKMRASYTSKAREVLSVVPKLDRRDKIAEMEHQVALAMSEGPESFGLSEGDSFEIAYSAVDELLYELMRGDILDSEKELEEELNEVRQVETETDAKGASWFGLFTRGETQVLYCNNWWL